MYLFYLLKYWLILQGQYSIYSGKNYISHEAVDDQAIDVMPHGLRESGC